MALRRYPDAIRTFVSILNFISRMKQYHTRSYQYDQVGVQSDAWIFSSHHSQINKTADRMYALFAICHALSPGRVDDQVQNAVKEKYGEQLGKMLRGYVKLDKISWALNNLRPSEEGLTPYEELFLYACPKFISSNAPPYHSLPLLASWVQDPPTEPATHHLRLFLADVQARLPTRNLRSYLKLYTSLDVRKLSGWVEVSNDVLPTTSDESGSEVGGAVEKKDVSPEEAVENMLCALMVLKLNGRSVCRVDDKGEGAGPSSATSGLLDGQLISTTDVDFVVNDVSSFRLLPTLWPDADCDLEYGSNRRVDSRTALRGMVH